MKDPTFKSSISRYFQLFFNATLGNNFSRKLLLWSIFMLFTYGQAKLKQSRLTKVYKTPSQANVSVDSVVLQF